MRLFIALIFVSALFFTSAKAVAQSSADTVQAKNLRALGNKYYNEEALDSSTWYYQKAAQIFRSIAEIKRDTVMWGKYIRCLYDVSMNLSIQFKSDQSKSTLDSALILSMKYFGNKHRQTALIYGAYGAMYEYISDFDRSLEYLLKQLEIYKTVFKANSSSLAEVYRNIGTAYYGKRDLNKSLFYLLSSLEIQKMNQSRNGMDLADIYGEIGLVYNNTREYNKALEYYMMSLAMYRELVGEKSRSVAVVYERIAGVNLELEDYKNSLANYLNSLEIQSELNNGKNIVAANLYDNIGIVYFHMGDYDKALEYSLKCSEIQHRLLPEKNVDVAITYKNLANIYLEKGDYPKALDNYFKNLGIRLQLFGANHLSIGTAYDNIAKAYSVQSNNTKALFYYQKAFCSYLPNFKDTTNLYSVPEITSETNWHYLIFTLRDKARILADTTRHLNDLKTLSTIDRLNFALDHYQECNKLIELAKKGIGNQLDKLFLGELAFQIYEESIGVCQILATLGQSKDVIKYKHLAFYFSEKGKSAVLLEALAGQEAQKFAGIPDDLLRSEHKLKTDIASYTEQLAGLGNTDSLEMNILQNRLFDCNRSYDSLIVVFEKKYPKYHELKYNVNTASIKDVQKLIDKKTAMLSYFVGDSTITIYTVTKNSYNIEWIKKPDDLSETVEFFRTSLTNSNEQSDKAYREYAASLYEMLFPKNLDKNIGNLVIVPDGVLATLPFETLLTAEVPDTTQFQNLPYLVRKYSISYCSSATLFKETFAKRKGAPSEVRPLNDWIAYAPVFDDENGKGTSLASRALIRELHKLNKDSTLTRGLMMGTGESVPPLPGSENEVKSIFNEFDKLNLKTAVELKGNASERSIKSGELENYKYIHLATHGFANSEKPELSGLLLAQVADSTNEQNDGILYSGEIFNLKLNADLVVLSACETGLGQIKKGEGIIGLTRALLYAGAKNLVVSLWPVSDESTSDLMIDFYKKLLNEKSVRLSNSVRFAPLLQQAKLKMISEAKFAHPYFWSPFILIGQ